MLLHSKTARPAEGFSIELPGLSIELNGDYVTGSPLRFGQKPGVAA
jgi:hypothetical protein